jgi:hypothetical protein
VEIERHQFADLVQRLGSIEVAVARIEETVKHNGEDLASLVHEVGGVTDPRGNRPSLRSRVHALEQDRRAVELAAEALERHERRLADERKRKGESLGRRAQIVGIAGTTIAGAGGLIYLGTQFANLLGS